MQKHDKKNIKKKPKTQDKGENQSNAPIVSGIASNWKVLVLPNLSANVPPVNEPTVAPASSVLTIHPTQSFECWDYKLPSNAN